MKACLGAVLVSLVLHSAAAAAAVRPLETAVWVPGATTPAELETAVRRIKAAGATRAGLVLAWRGIAPATRPDAFSPENHEDPAYNWTAFDERVRAVARAGLELFVAIHYAPAWAEGRGSGPAGTVRPNAAEFGKFARAAATRYSGRYFNLPRVRYWQAWGEPNISNNLNPQFENRRPIAPFLYRRMLNAFATAVKSVDGDNVVVAGGTAPFRDVTIKHRHWGPLTFIREMFCLSKRLARKCRTRVQFDIWSHHPYTSGGPTHSALLPDDVSLGDLPELRRTLQAAVRVGHVASRRPLGLWVTEFSWDSRPPDPAGVPSRLLTRWVAEALYRMWGNGITVVTWLQLRDHPPSVSFEQSGLYYHRGAIADDRPKPMLRAFRFPLVAFPRGRGIQVWGRTPGSRPATVIVEQRAGRRWRRLGYLRTNRYGIFQHRYRTTRSGFVRARTAAGERAVPFSLRHVPDRWFSVFGYFPNLDPKKRKRR